MRRLVVEMGIERPTTPLAVRDDKEQTIAGGSSDKNSKDGVQVNAQKSWDAYLIYGGSFKRKSGCSAFQMCVSEIRMQITVEADTWII